MLEWLRPGSPDRQTLITYFASRGPQQLDRYQLEEARRDAAQVTRVIDGLHRSIAERDGRIEWLNHAVAERDNQIARMTRALSDLETRIAQMQSSRSWRLTRPLRAIRRGIDRVKGDDRR